MLAAALPPPSRTRLHLFLAFGLVVCGAAAAVSGAAKELALEPRPLALAVGAAALLLPPWALLLCARVPLALLAVPTGFALWGLARALGLPARDGLALLGLAPGLVVAWCHVVAPLRRRLAAQRALQAVEAAAGAAGLAAHLEHEDDAVRTRAAARLGTLPAAEVADVLRAGLRAAAPRARAAARAALAHQARGADGFDLARELLRAQVRDADVTLAAEAAGALAALDALGDLMDSLAPGEERAPVRLAYARGLLAATAASDGTGSRASLAATLLASLLGDPRLEPALREEALDAFDHVPPSEARAVALPLLVRDDVTPELLWLLAERGAVEDLPRLARWASREPYPRASAAVAAVESVMERASEAAVRAHAATARAAVAGACEALRAVHPAGDNDLADDLVARLEDVLAALEPEGPEGAGPPAEGAGPPAAGAGPPAAGAGPPAEGAGPPAGAPPAEGQGVTPPAAPRP